MRRDATTIAGLLAAMCWLGALGAHAQQAPGASATTAPETAAQPAPVPEAGAGATATTVPAEAATAETAARTQAEPQAEATPQPRATTAPKRALPPETVDEPPPKPAPEPAVDGRFTFGASFTPRWNSDPSYDFFAEDDVVTAYGLWLGYDLVRFASRFALAAELGWSTEFEEQSGLAGGTLDTQLRTCAWEVSGDLRWEALDVLWPHIRLGGGFAKNKVHVDASTDGSFEDLDFSGTLVAGLGATLKTPAGLFRTASGKFSSFSLGLRVEVGYRVMAPTSVNLEPEDDSNGGDIPVALSNLGEVSRSGPYLGFSLVGRI